MEELFIKNRKMQNLSVIVEKNDIQQGLVLVMHGLGGFKEQNHIKIIADAFKEKGYTVVRFDTTNTLGESDGEYEKATVTNYYEDLEDIISWAKTQEWYQVPFCLAGHSIGGLCTALYAERYPEQVLALAPISPVVSGKLSMKAHKLYEPEELEMWKTTGWFITKSASKPNVTKKLEWSHMEDRLKYDLLPDVSRLTMPVLLIVGENDKSTPPDQVQILFDALSGPKELHVIKDAPHTFRDTQHLDEIKRLLLNWIDKLAK